MTRKHIHLIAFILFSILLSCFYYHFVNLSTDTIILFLAQKIFLGKWLAGGILPLFNPHIFLGVPFAFDVGMGNIHPFNLFFALPYPLSFAVWVGITVFIFLYGFYLFFCSITKDKTLALLYTFILFFSGSGFVRLNNPTIFVTIAHYGIFLYSLSFLREKKGGYVLPLIVGFFMTISGHLQFVVYGYILGFLVAIFHYKISLKKTVLFFILLAFSTSWYYIFSLPLVMDSTRLGAGKEYADIGSIRPLQHLQLILPFYLGMIQNGSSWNAGPTTVILSSLLLEERWRKSYLLLIFFSITAFVFFVSPLFPLLFQNGYAMLKHGAVSLFFTLDTVRAIGRLMGLSFIPMGLLGFMMYAGSMNKKYGIYFLLLFVFIEGLLVNYFHGYFIPASALSVKTSFPKSIDAKTYRIQSTSDVIPYTGFHTYMSSIMFRPPFSKEKSMIDLYEEQSYDKLKKTLVTIPTSWAAVANTYAVQGYNTFVPKKLATYFSNFSHNYQSEYSYIISRNEEFAKTTKTSHINALDTSRVTMNDDRWGRLGIRYIISDRPLKKYELLLKEGGTYYYEIESAPPIYRYIEGTDKETVAVPTYVNPNRVEFAISKKEISKKLVLIMNPKGFVAFQNGKEIPIEKGDLEMIIQPTQIGRLTVFYSPLRHLIEVFRKE